MSEKTKSKQSNNGNRVLEKPLSIGPLMTPEQREAEQDRLVANMLAGIEQEEIRLELLKKVNRHTDNDVVPGEREPRTYAEAQETVERNRRQIAETCGEEQIERVRTLVQSS